MDCGMILSDGHPERNDVEAGGPAVVSDTPGAASETKDRSMNSDVCVCVCTCLRVYVYMHNMHIIGRSVGRMDGWMDTQSILCILYESDGCKHDTRGGSP